MVVDGEGIGIGTGVGVRVGAGVGATDGSAVGATDADWLAVCVADWLVAGVWPGIPVAVGFKVVSASHAAIDRHKESKIVFDFSFILHYSSLNYELIIYSIIIA